LNKTIIVGIMLTLLILSTLTFAFNIIPVEASGTIYIRADGNIDPSSAPISRDGNVYTFTDNIYEPIVIERSNIVLDGAGLTVEGSGDGTGIYLQGITGVTIKNMEIKAFGYGIMFNDSSNNNSISGINITQNTYGGILLSSSSNYNSVSGNNITNNGLYGIVLGVSSYNNIVVNNIKANNQYGICLNMSTLHNNMVGNNITDHDEGIRLDGSSNNTISGNEIVDSLYGIRVTSSNYNNVTENNITGSDWVGIVLGDSSNNSISANSIKYNGEGIRLSNSLRNSIGGNDIRRSNYSGILLVFSSNYNSIIGNSIIENNYAGIGFNGSSNSYNNITENALRDNQYGMWFYSSSDNRIWHNNFVDNINQVYSYGDESVNVWDDGYPSGGNYWSDYTGTDLFSGPYQNETDNDGRGDTSYTIGESNIDRYPLISPWIRNVPSHMVLAYLVDSQTLDPHRAYDTASVELLRNVYESLVLFDEEKTDQFVPRLATEWDISEDGLNYTLTIRQDVKFHNNEKLTTEDVEYSFERLIVIEGELAWMFYEAFFDLFGSRDPEGGFIITGQQIDDAITRTDTTVTLHLAKPYTPMMQILSQTWGSILCKKWCKEIGDWPGSWGNWTSYNRPATTAIETQTTDPPGPRINAMCGTGPFMLDYYRKGVEWSIMKFDSYWGRWPAPGSNGFLERVTSKKISDWETRREMFLEGDLDNIPVPKVATNEVLGQPGIRWYYPLEELSCYAFFFTFNISVSSPYMGVPGGLPPGTLEESGIPPDFFTDINVRKGFAYAFNYSKLIQEELSGEAFQPATPIVPGLPFHNPAQEKYSINLDRAVGYFVEAWGGEVWDKGFNFTICYNPVSLVRKKICEIIKANVESLNDKFHIQIQELPLGNYSASVSRNEVPIFIYGWIADFADPHNFAYGFMQSNGAFPPLQRYCNGTIDTLIGEGIGTTNETARRNIYYDLQALYHEDCPSVPVYQLMQRRFERDWVQGWYYNPLLWMTNYFYVQWKGKTPTSTRYSWPMFHHDLKHTGCTESPAPNTNQTRWNFPTGGLLYGPVVADGRVYVGSGDKNVYCLDALTGALIWNYTTGDLVSSSPAVVDGRVYVGSDDRNVYCLDALTGALIWNYTTGYWVFSSPAVADGRVYVGSCDNKVYCLDALTGALIWNYTTGNFVRSCPAVVDGKVYVGSDDNKTYCLDALTGAQIWNYTTGGYVFSSPAVVDGKAYVGSCDNKTYCLDALTGALIWNYTTGYYVTSSPAVADGKVYVGSYDFKVYCLNASTGDNIWSYKTGDWVHSSPAVADGVVYVGSDDCTVYAFGNVIRVPEDFPTIQEAINNATAGATIIIAPGVYNESIVVNKTLTIIGLPGSAPVFSGGGSGIAITLESGASGSIIAGIVITHWDQGILLVNSANCKIYDNIMSLMSCNGIALEGSSATNNLIYSNIFHDNTIAISSIASSTTNTIYKNIITLSNIGLKLETSGNIVYANIIAENHVGINMTSSNNIIYHNNFINNDEQAKIEALSNTWDNGYPSGGNYWSDHTSPDQYSGANTPQNDPNSDGIVDTPYTIASNNVDRYPLVQPFNPHDIGITNIIPSATIIVQGSTITIDLKILNYGMYDETFTATTYANTFIINIQTITLTKRNSITITFSWNTQGFTKGVYTISAVATTVPDETDTADNSFTDGVVVKVTYLGDFDGDFDVDYDDIVYFVTAYIRYWSGQGKDPMCDFDKDCDIDYDDIVAFVTAYIDYWTP